MADWKRQTSSRILRSTVSCSKLAGICAFKLKHELATVENLYNYTYLQMRFEDYRLRLPVCRKRQSV
jgi:hypothetical protein